GGVLSGVGVLVVVVLLPAAPGPRALGPPVPRPSVGSEKGGVGSNGSQPAPSIHTSGHACALRLVTWYSPSPPSVPGWYPTATRDGRPTARASAAYDAANCSQKPLRVLVRNSVRSSGESPRLVWNEYVNAPGRRKNSRSATARWYGPCAPAVIERASLRTVSGKSLGSWRSRAHLCRFENGARWSWSGLGFGTCES